MFKESNPSSLISLILPPTVMESVTRQVFDEHSGTTLLLTARGSLLQDQWFKRWLPPISPSKSMLQIMVPEEEVDKTIERVVRTSKLDQQALGAVFSSESDHVFFGPDYQRWTGANALSANTNRAVKDKLHVIYCIVSHKQSDRICRAAIDAGAHGPIVHYSEGRGLRDRLGWLRITKEHEKEVLMVLCNEDTLEPVFDAMATAGELHLPGRGFMYQIDIEHGMFNLPSRAAPKHHDASIQQIIAAIDSLQGHSHWRDPAVVQIGKQGQAIGMQKTSKVAVKDDQHRIFAVVAYEQLNRLIDLMLDNGAPGLNFTQARNIAKAEAGLTEESSLTEEYAVIRSITDAESAQRIAQVIEDDATSGGVTNLCAAVSPVSQVATYVPGSIDFRKTA